MGKMQKKKPVGQKKVRKQAGDSASGDIQKDRDESALAEDGTPGSHETKPQKQKTALSASKKSAGDQTFLMKLLDRYFGHWIQFLREVRNELSKVVWPTRRDTTGMTAVVLVFVIIISLFLGIIDFGLSSIVRIIL